MVLIAHFNQLHRWREPFRLDRYKYLSSSPLFWTRLQREQSIYLTLHTAAGLLAAVMTAQHLKKKEEKGVSSAALAKQHGFMTKSHKASGVGGVIVVEMMLESFQ